MPEVGNLDVGLEHQRASTVNRDIKDSLYVTGSSISVMSGDDRASGSTGLPRRGAFPEQAVEPGPGDGGGGEGAGGKGRFLFEI